MGNEAGNNNSSEFKSLETNDDIQALQRKIAVLEKENERFEEEIVGLKSQKKYLVEDRDSCKKERDSFKDKFMTVTSKLHDQIECPVCLEVPTSGPVFCCPNGHLVCSKCKDTNCPTCRSKMFNGKSLLAVTAIENIDHKCKNDGCKEVFPLAEYETHLNICPHRIISCPAPNQWCTKKIALSKVYEHILTECEGSSNKSKNSDLNNGKYPKHLVIITGTGTISMNGLCLDFEDNQFYLNMEEGAGCAVFSFQLLDNADKCKDFEVTIAVHRIDDQEMKGKYVQRLVWEPFPVDLSEEERKMNGLMVGFKMLEKIAVEEGDNWKFSITVDLKKV